MEIDKSDVVMSLNGRDKGRVFFVIETDETFALLCDGKMRRIEKPKRKKIKHLRLEARYECRTSMKIRGGEKVTNSEIRRALAEYMLKSQGEKGGM